MSSANKKLLYSCRTCHIAIRHVLRHGHETMSCHTTWLVPIGHCAMTSCSANPSWRIQKQSAKKITRVRGVSKPPAPFPQGWGFERGSRRWSWTKHGLNLLTDFCIGLRCLLSFGIYVHKRGQGSSAKIWQHCFTCKAAHAFRSKRGQILVSKSGRRFRP